MVSSEITQTETACLALCANGYSSDKTAQKLNITPKEVEILLYCAQRKLGANNRLHAISLALTSGVIQIDGAEGRRHA